MSKSAMLAQLWNCFRQMGSKSSFWAVMAEPAASPPCLSVMCSRSTANARQSVEDPGMGCLAKAGEIEREVHVLTEGPSAFEQGERPAQVALAEGQQTDLS